MKIRRVISGAQTGADRAGLDVAIALGIPHGGWVPKGRRAEDGIIDAKYKLRECESSNYAVRTRKNVDEAEATLILSFGEQCTGGTKLTFDYANGRRTLMLFDPRKLEHVDRVHMAMDMFRRETLNIAGPRESKQPGIYAASYAFLMRVLGGAK